MTVEQSVKIEKIEAPKRNHQNKWNINVKQWKVK